MHLMAHPCETPLTPTMRGFVQTLTIPMVPTTYSAFCNYATADFITYHTLAVKVIQWVDPEYPKAPQFPMRMRQLGLLWLMGYATAYVEAWSISSFPHYRYPDREAMMTVGSAFYSLLFVVTYPMYVELHRSHAAEEKCSIWQVFCHALAASMIVLVLYETWRLSIGRISRLVDDTVCPPYTHSILGQPDSVSVVSRP